MLIEEIQFLERYALAEMQQMVYAVIVKHAENSWNCIDKSLRIEFKKKLRL